MNSRTADPMEVAALLLTVDLMHLEPRRQEVELIALDNASGDVHMAMCCMISIRDEPAYAAEVLDGVMI